MKKLPSKPPGESKIKDKSHKTKGKTKVTRQKERQKSQDKRKDKSHKTKGKESWFPSLEGLGVGF